MQIDWHHGVTYILARLAGFSHSDAAIVAYAAQYVDDANNMGNVSFDNGATYHHIASAHEVFDVTHNFDNIEDYRVWIPFHFLPGNKGNPADRVVPDVPLIDRLICTPDSPLAGDMWAACLATRGSVNSLHRLGITTHVYADTFAHQGFAGVRHRANMVFHVGEKQGMADAIKDDCAALAVNAVALGHGSAQTHPDTPFVHWWYRNAYGDFVDRNNPEIFGHAFRRIFSNFVYYLGGVPDREVAPHDAEVITNTLVTTTSLDSGERHRRWIDLVRDGAFSFGSATDEELADLVYVPKGVGSWKYDALGTDRPKDSPDEVFPYRAEFESSNWKRFHDALKDHQHHILNVVLKRYRIPDSYEAATTLLC